MRGYTPAQINEMSLWEFLACLDAHTPKKSGGGDLSEEQLREMGVEGF